MLSHGRVIVTGAADRRPDREGEDPVLLGLRTATYPVRDLAASKKWFASVLHAEPYFDEPFYVGFRVAGYELGLVPAGDGESDQITYWGVADADAALQCLIDAGAEPHSPATDVGDGIRLGAVREPSGNLFGVIANPRFDLSEVSVESPGPGR